MGVGRDRNLPSQIRFVEEITALECLSPSFHLPRALTPPTCLEEGTRGGFKMRALGGREQKKHHRTKDDPLIRREIKCNWMPSSFSRHDASYQPHGQALDWAHLNTQSAMGLGVLQRGWGYGYRPWSFLNLCFSFDSHWPMIPRALLFMSLRWCYLCSKTWLCEDFLTRGPPSFLFCFRHLWCWTKGGPFPGLVPLGPCGYSVLSTWSEEQPSKCLSTHILCTVDSSAC